MGVLVDDLITQGCLEPYRLFTSRAEHRLRLRADNADVRLTPRGRAVGLVDEERWRRFVDRSHRMTAVRASLAARERGPGATTHELCAQGGCGAEGLTPTARRVDERDRLTVEADEKYAGYLKRQRSILDQVERLDGVAFPPAFDYVALPGLSAEVRERLGEVRPQTLGQASRIPGVTPAAVALLARILQRHLA